MGVLSVDMPNRDLAESHLSSTHPHFRRNFFLLLTDYVCFGAALSLVSVNTVVPDFVSRLTSSDVIIGLSGALYMFAWLVPQLLLAQMVNRRTRRKPIMAWTVVPFRMTMLVMAALIAGSDATNRSGILLTFLSFYVLFALGDGLITIVWADMLGGSIPERWRGILFSTGQIGVSISALGAREIVRLLLGPSGPPFPHNYAAMFGIAAVVFVIGGCALAAMVEEQSQVPVEPGPPMRQYMAYLGRVLREDRDFMRLMVTRLLFDLTTMALPFYVVFGATGLLLHREALVGDSILLGTIGTTIGSLLTGWLSRRSGSRAVIRASGIASLLHPSLAFLSLVAGQPALYAAFLVNGLVAAAMTPGYFDWIITHAPPDRRPIYIGLANTISAVSHLAPFFGGVVLSLTSYPILFGLSALIAVVGIGSTLGLSEPRQHPSMIAAYPPAPEPVESLVSPDAR
jgi:MFS family permease